MYLNYIKTKAYSFFWGRKIIELIQQDSMLKQALRVGLELCDSIITILKCFFEFFLPGTGTFSTSCLFSNSNV